MVFCLAVYLTDAGNPSCRQPACNGGSGSVRHRSCQCSRTRLAVSDDAASVCRLCRPCASAYCWLASCCGWPSPLSSLSLRWEACAVARSAAVCRSLRGSVTSHRRQNPRQSTTREAPDPAALRCARSAAVLGDRARGVLQRAMHCYGPGTPFKCVFVTDGFRVAESGARLWCSAMLCCAVLSCGPCRSESGPFSCTCTFLASVVTAAAPPPLCTLGLVHCHPSHHACHASVHLPPYRLCGNA